MPRDYRLRELEWWVHKPKNAKDCWQPPKAKKRPRFFPRAFRAWPWWHLAFGLLAFRTVREDTVIVLNHPVCSIWLQQYWETNTPLLTEFLGGWPSVPVFPEDSWAFSVTSQKVSGKSGWVCHSTFWPTGALNWLHHETLWRPPPSWKSSPFLVPMIPALS